MAQAVARACAAGLARAAGSEQGSWWFPGSVLDMQFELSRYRSINAGQRNTLPAFLAAMSGSFARASTATYFDANGVLQTASSNVPRVGQVPGLITRLGYLPEEPRANGILNPTGAGAVAGTPGTQPTGVIANVNGNVGSLAVSVAASGPGTESGIPYWDVTIAGTATGAGFFQAVFVPGASGPAAASGQLWTTSAYLRVVAGSLSGVTNTGLVINELDAAGAFIRNDGSNVFSITAGQLNVARQVLTRTLSGGVSVARVQSGFVFSYSTTPINVTFRIGLPVLELGAFASSPNPTGGGSRPGDVMSIPTAVWYNAPAMTFLVDYTPLTAADTAAETLFAAHDGTLNNRLGAFTLNGLTGVINRIRSAAATYDTPQVTAGLTPGVKAKLVTAASVALGGALVLNNGTVSTGAVAAMPTGITTLDIGHQLSSQFGNCLIHRLIAVPTRQLDAIAKALSA